MEKTNQAVELLKDRLKEIEADFRNKKEEIEKQYTNTMKKASETRTISLAELANETKEKTNILNALRALGEGNKTAKSIEIPVKYSTELPFIKKVIYALAEIKSGDVEDVKAKLLKLEPNISEKSLDDLNQNLSGLYTKSKILAIRNGRRNTYSIE